MSSTAKILVERIDQLIELKGVSRHWLSRQVSNGNSGSVILDIERKETIPKADRLEAIAALLETTTDYLLGKVDDPGPREMKTELIMEGLLPFHGFPRDQSLPVLGTAHGGTVIRDTNGGDAEIEQTLFEPTQVVRYIIRPPALNGVTEAYAVYIQGESMDPRYRQGELAVVDPRIAPQIGDDVIVQITQNGDNEITAILIKTLVRRSASFIELEQYNPAIRFRIDSKRVQRIHRIMPPVDLLGG